MKDKSSEIGTGSVSGNGEKGCLTELGTGGIEELLGYMRAKHPERHRQFLETAYADPVVGQRLLDRTLKPVGGQSLSEPLLLSLKEFCHLREQEQAHPLG